MNKLENTFRGGDLENVPLGDFMGKLKEICDGVFPRKTAVNRWRKGKYWWNGSTEEKRKNCHKIRRGQKEETVRGDRKARNFV